MGAVLATRGAAWGLIVGIILHITLSDLKKNKNVVTNSQASTEVK